jgi:hypothetical protein
MGRTAPSPESVRTFHNLQARRGSGTLSLVVYRYRPGLWCMYIGALRSWGILVRSSADAEARRLNF